MRRRLLQLLLAVTAFALPLAAVAPPARADNASSLLVLVNALRARHGVGPLYADPTLTRVAQPWSAHMASTQVLGHNPSIGSQVTNGWTKLGENVGAGGNVPAVFNAFVNSPFHYQNMVDPTYNLTGIAVVAGANGTLWITQDFEGKPGATPAPTTPPAPLTTSRPVATTNPTRATMVAPATTIPTSTIPATTSVAPPVSLAGGSGTGGTGGNRLAAPASAALAAHRAGSSIAGWVLGLSLAGIAVVTAGALVVTRVLRTT